jgi:hypothetical protein
MALVEIRRFYGPEEAQVAASMLRAAGIEVLVQNEQLGMSDFIVRNAIGGFRLWVPEDDREEAYSLLPPLQTNLPPEPDRAVPTAPGWMASLRGLVFGR